MSDQYAVEQMTAKELSDALNTMRVLTKKKARSDAVLTAALLGAQLRVAGLYETAAKVDEIIEALGNVEVMIHES